MLLVQSGSTLDPGRPDEARKDLDKGMVSVSAMKRDVVTIGLVLGNTIVGWTSST